MDNARLLVEGKDDAHVLYALLKRYEIPKCFQIDNADGIENLLERFPIELKRSNQTRLGVLVDADIDLNARWAQIKNLLQNSGYESIPDRPHPEGTIVCYTGDELDIVPIVGIWLMPNNEIPGMLEDFVQFLVPSEDELLPYAAQCIDGLPEQRFRESYRSKAKIHTWLSWQDEPGTPLGLAITKRYLDTDGAQVQGFINWIRRLFVENRP